MLGATSSQLVDIARRRTGLSDLGDAAFLTALGTLVDSIDRETILTEDGMSAAQERLLRLLVNRLRFQADIGAHPEILEQALVPPVIICGLPRVGSTKLHHLLAAGGDFQALLFWQGFNPAPLPGSPGADSDPRIAQAVKFLEWRARLNPATNAAHFMAALEPEEDTYLLEFTLRTYWPISYFEVPSFLSWLKTQSRDSAFLYVSRLLKYLQWQFHRAKPRPWILKSPPNLGYEDCLARHLPGARFVVLHRDPVQVVPSAAAIVREVRRLYCGAPANGPSVGAWALDEFSAAMDRHLVWRQSAAAGSVLDVPYRDVRDDDIEVVRRVYRFCSMPLSRQAEERMQAWSRSNSQHKHGVHRYSLEESGLSEERIKSKFAAYMSRFAGMLGDSAC